jgi:thioredoxin reductase/Fe-S-cluster-containing hydrogenase component 2
VERLPVTDDEGRTNVPGCLVAGDLRGTPLLKLSSETGARAVRTILAEPSFEKELRSKDAAVLPLAIVGAGVAGMAAALEARKHGIDFALLEAAEPFSTIVNFPRGKPIYTYPKDMIPDSELSVNSAVKEALVAELRAQTISQGVTPRIAHVERVRRTKGAFDVVLTGGEKLRALRVILALGRSGNFRKLSVPGEELDKVYNRLHDPKDFAGARALVVGGGDSALETAIALAMCGSEATVSYRKAELSRPKPENVKNLEKLAANPQAPDVSIEAPSSERVTTSVGGFLSTHRKAGRIHLALGSRVVSIHEGEVELESAGGIRKRIPNDVVFTMIGREAPLDFFRRSGVNIAGDWSARSTAFLAAFLLFVAFLYEWKAGGDLTKWFDSRNLFPFGFERPADPGSLLGTLKVSAAQPSFWYSAAYSAAIVAFGIRRIRRRRTPYVKAQTLTLMAIQVVPLFLLPNFVLPWVGHRGAFGDRHSVVTLVAADIPRWEALLGELPEGREVDSPPEELRALLPAPIASWSEIRLEKSWGHRVILRSGERGERSAVLRLADARAHLLDDSEPSSFWADELFPASEWDPHGREYWRASGFILAWPLFVWNVFTEKPLALWLVISVLQTLVAIPALIYFFGKGAYCGWICSCGALAETLGDAHRHKMPHGPAWNRVNLVGQGILALAGLLLALRIAAWVLPPEHPVREVFMAIFLGKTSTWSSLPWPWTQLNYKWFVDLFLVGVLGTGLYFHFSGRVWCRFACPLAALMHVYARFSRFRILPEKSKCISCNLCTSVCHQGIDIMNFANKGIPMEDPECVRCSACVHVCPTGVLSFGQVDSKGAVLRTDRLAASPVQMREGKRAAVSEKGRASP